MKKKLFTFLLILLLIEIFLRIFKPSALDFYWVQKQAHRLDKDYLVDLEPNMKERIVHFQGFFDMNFSTNEFGFRATDPINNSIPQIACIGDSVTMGFGVNDEDTFCRKLNGFTSKDNIKYQSINMAVDAYGPSAISLKLKKYIPNLNVKLLYYFPSNGDDIDEKNFYNKMNNPNSLLLFKTQFLLTKYSYLVLGIRITQEQFVYRFNETFIYPLQKMVHTKKCLDRILPEDECENTYFPYKHFSIIEEFTRPNKKTDDVTHFAQRECMDTPEDFTMPDSMIKALDEIIQFTKEKNIKLVIVTTPLDLETAYCSQNKKFHRFYSYQDKLKVFLKERGIDHLDLNRYTYKMTDSKGRMNVRPYYILGDGHYTKLGNQWVADHLLKKTKKILD